MYDVTIIGGGVIGASIARELSKYQAKVLLIEKEKDVSLGVTKANSGIVHGCYATEHGTLKGALAAKGNMLFKSLNDELNFGYRQTGGLVAGFTEEDEKRIRELYDNGIKYGESRQDLQIIGPSKIRELEPHSNPDIKIALYSRNVGVTSPYEMTIALVENAMTNGVEVLLGKKVQRIQKQEGYFIVDAEGKRIETKQLINAAGLYSDEIARMAGLSKYTILPRKGQYILFGKDQGHLVNHVIFQVPNVKGKGILVTTTYHGNFMIGPNAEEVSDRADLSTTKESLQYIIDAARRSIPGFKLQRAITTFSGIRASIKEKDFVIDGDMVQGMINLIGIDSPGLTAAPAIGKKVTEMLSQGGLNLTLKENFTAYRAPLVLKKSKDFDGSTEHEDPKKKIVCRCETVTEAEIVESFTRGLPVESVQSLKFRTRAGMGQCQGAYCEKRVKKLMQQELGIPYEEIPMNSHREEIELNKVNITEIRKMT